MLMHYKEASDQLFSSQIDFILSVLRSNGGDGEEDDDQPTAGGDEEEEDFDDEVCFDGNGKLNFNLWNRRMNYPPSHMTPIYKQLPHKN
jgi:hypothetical protein